MQVSTYEVVVRRSTPVLNFMEGSSHNLISFGLSRGRDRTTFMMVVRTRGPCLKAGLSILLSVGISLCFSRSN